MFGKPRAIRWAKAALVIIVLVLSAIGAKPASAASFPNGGFEIDPTNSSNGWTWPSNDWVWDGSIAHSGAHSARVIEVLEMQQPVYGLHTSPCNLRLYIH